MTLSIHVCYRAVIQVEGSSVYSISLLSTVFPYHEVKCEPGTAMSGTGAGSDPAASGEGRSRARYTRHPWKELRAGLRAMRELSVYSRWNGRGGSFEPRSAGAGDGRDGPGGRSSPSGPRTSSPGVPEKSGDEVRYAHEVASLTSPLRWDVRHNRRRKYGSCEHKYE